MSKSTPINQLPRHAPGDGESIQLTQRREDFIPPGNPPHEEVPVSTFQGMPPPPHNRPPERYTPPPPQQPPMPAERYFPPQANPPMPQGPPMPIRPTVYRLPVKEPGFFDYLKNNAKTLLVLFVILLVVQLEGSQQIFRKMVSAMKIPDGFVLPSAKVFAALLGATAFLFLMKTNSLA